jgi:diaminopimelate epimerase
MGLKFHKMHGAGNDFVLLDLREQEFTVDADSARSLADRNTGIGCDQLLILTPPSVDDCLVDFDVWNADGSKAEQCGNGVRCIGLYLSSRNESGNSEFSINGPVSKVVLQERENGFFRVNMGPPVFETEKIPMELVPTIDGYELSINGKTRKIGAVSMGNPHALLETDDINDLDFDRVGGEISRHPAFPNGCNAGIAKIIDRQNIDLRVFERGAGETLACGSGACAAVSILIKCGKLDEEVVVNQRGGTLIIEWKGENAPVMMTGPAVHLYVGILTT